MNRNFMGVLEVIRQFDQFDSFCLEFIELMREQVLTEIISQIKMI